MKNRKTIALKNQQEGGFSLSLHRYRLSSFVKHILKGFCAGKAFETGNKPIGKRVKSRTKDLKGQLNFCAIFVFHYSFVESFRTLLHNSNLAIFLKDSVFLTETSSLKIKSSFKCICCVLTSMSQNIFKV